MTALHHGAVVVGDVEESLRFYRDGIGLVVLMDQAFEGPWGALFDAPTDRLRSVFLGDPQHPNAGIVELVHFDGVLADAERSRSARGFFLFSFYVDVDGVLARLVDLGFEADARRLDVPGRAGLVAMATVRDPDGLLVELVGAPPS